MSIKKILILGFLARVLFLAIFVNINNFDIESYLKIGRITFSGNEIYHDHAAWHHPYFPFFLYIQAFAFSFVKYVDPRVFIKAVILIFDTGVICLIYLISRNTKQALSYAFNPIPLLIFGLHGQFDAIPIFFVLSAVHFLQKKHELAASLAFSFAIMAKTWPVLLFSVFSKRIKQVCVLFFPLFPVVSVFLYSVVFRSNLQDIIKTVLNYQGLYGLWGLTELPIFIKAGYLEQKVISLFFLTGYFLFSFFLKRKSVVEEIYFLLLFFFVFTSGFSIQYFSWLVPFAILSNKKSNHLFLLITLTLISFYVSFVFDPNNIFIKKTIEFSQKSLSFFTWLSFLAVLMNAGWYMKKN